MAFTLYRTTTAGITPTTAVTNTDPTVKMHIRGFNITNSNSYDIHIKFYDVNYTSVTVGTTVPSFVLKVPGDSSIYSPWQDDKIIGTFQDYLTFAATKFISNTDATAPASNTIIVELSHELA